MKHLLSTAAMLLLTFVFVNVLPAQDVPRTINGGILNGKAVSLPKPAYPDEAKAAKAEGTVSIKVLIDEEGNVIEAVPQPRKSTRRTNLDGSTEIIDEEMPDQALAEAARAAALGAKFSPTRLSGEPVKVTGIITYNFSLADKQTINSGVLNGEAISLPAAEYPAAAKAVKASGTVAVQVLIDEGGNVKGATAISGHPLLRAAAVQAAREAKFNPTYLEGKAVKVSGVVTYNFVLPDDGHN